MLPLSHTPSSLSNHVKQQNPLLNTIQVYFYLSLSSDRRTGARSESFSIVLLLNRLQGFQGIADDALL